jgi:hypothetical protein
VEHLGDLTNCEDLSPLHIENAAQSAARMERLLSRSAEIAKPGSGAPRILSALARLGHADCRWIEGDVFVELTGDAQRTTIAVFTDHGFGIREKLFASFEFSVPLDEFTAAIDAAPGLLTPLRRVNIGAKVVLARGDYVPSAPPPGFVVPEDDPDERETAPPVDGMTDSSRPTRLPRRDSGADVHSRPTVPRIEVLKVTKEEPGSGENDR